MKKSIITSIIFTVALPFLSSGVFATSTLVEEQGPKYKMTTTPSESLFLKKSRATSRDVLITDLMAGIIQGVDSNPNLDSTHKADNYTQEVVDMHFKYPICESSLGKTDSTFGFNINNVTYYQITDISILDGIFDANLEQNISDDLKVGAGYNFEYLWYPNYRDGTYFGNEFNGHIWHRLVDRVYQKGTYRILLKNFVDRKIRLGNATTGSPLRRDVKNTFEHELGAYITDITKLRIINQFAVNDSNDQYYDFFDYFTYRVGASVTQVFTKKLYGIAGFYYQRKNYDDRQCTDKQKEQRDNLYTVTSSLMYDITKSISVFVNYSHSENHTNEPVERYSDSLYTAGLYYSF